MPDRKTTLIAIGGGEMSAGSEILDEMLSYLEGKGDPRLAVMTVATNESESAAVKYNGLFRRLGIRHVDVVDVSQREDSFARNSIKKVESADAFLHRRKSVEHHQPAWRNAAAQPDIREVQEGYPDRRDECWCGDDVELDDHFGP